MAYGYVLHSYGLNSYGLNSHGLYSYGPYPRRCGSVARLVSHWRVGEPHRVEILARRDAAADDGSGGARAARYEVVDVVEREVAEHRVPM